METNIPLGPTQYVNIDGITPLITPSQLKEKHPISPTAVAHVREHRRIIESILSGHDSRLLVVVGPCSIHDPKAALDYAHRLRDLQHTLKEELFIVMRCYFEKPRTTVGWRGFLYDPSLAGQGDIQAGLTHARELLLQIVDMGVPVATEMLDPIVPQYIADLISWASIGARTTESQTHRDMASGLSMPVGFKNSTEGNLDIAINAMEAARHPHSFLGINSDGQISIIRTRGNGQGHIILRGGTSPNYDVKTILDTEEKLRKANFTPAIMVDCSHGNSNKQFEKQEQVAYDVVKLICEGHKSLIGIMLESNIIEGRQSVGADLSQLTYGVSITDACIGWDTTVRLLRDIAIQIRQQ
jgi:3-deoxy-7-phosphoheptulonate synthase